MARNGSSRFAVCRPVLGAAVLLCAAGPAGAQPEGGGTYGDVGQALVLLVIFGILLFILGRFAWKPVIAQLKRREQEIGERLRDTERRQQEAKELEAHYRARLDRADAEAKQVLGKSLQEAAKAREELLSSAREEGAKAVESAKAEIEQFKHGALEDLQQATAHLAVDIAGEILREEMDDRKQKELVAKSLERIRNRAARDSG